MNQPHGRRIYDLLTLGFKELGKLASLEVYEVRLPDASVTGFPVAAPEEYYAGCLRQAIEKNEKRSHMLGRYLDFIQAPEFKAHYVQQAFCKKLIQGAFEHPSRYAIVTGLFNIDGCDMAYVVHVERSVQERGFVLSGMPSIVAKLLADEPILGDYSQGEFYDDSAASFREFMIKRLVTEYVNNIEAYSHYSEAVTADKLRYLLRDTAQDYIVLIQNQKLGTSGGEQSIYKNLDMISSLNYEGSEIDGKLLLRRDAYTGLTMRFLEPIRLGEYKKIRKLLQITKSELFLVSDGAYVYGFTDIGPLADAAQADEDVYIVSFLRRNIWRLLGIAGEALTEVIQVEYSFPRLQKSKIDLNEVLITFYDVFKSEQRDMEHIFDIINAAVEQKSGTMLIFSDAAETEAVRLKNAAIGLCSRRLMPSDIKCVTEIDGAVLFDPSGICHAIGVILDGMSSSDTGEDISRGARYNAAVKYLNSNRGINAVAVIVSEDGNIDIMSNYYDADKKSSL